MRKLWYRCKRSGFKTPTPPFSKTHRLLEGLPRSTKEAWRTLIKMTRMKASQLQPAHLLPLLFSALLANRGVCSGKSRSKMLQSSKSLTRSQWPYQRFKEFQARDSCLRLIQSQKKSHRLKVVGLSASSEEKDSHNPLARIRVQWSRATRIRACASLPSAWLSLQGLWSSTSYRTAMMKASRVCELLRRSPAAHSSVGTNQSAP